MELIELRHSKYFDFVLARLNHNELPEYSLNDLKFFDSLAPKLLITIIKAFEDNWYLNDQYYEEYSITDILTYLYSTHEYYKTRVLKTIERLILNLSKENYGHPVIQQFRASYCDFKSDFLQHLAQEERIVFPYIELILQFNNKKVNSILNQVDVLSLLKHDHTPPESHPFFGWVHGLKTMKISGIHEVLKLEIIIDKFSRDLTVHSFIEEEILYPKAQIKLQQP